MPADDKPVVEIDRLTKKYGDFTALDRLSLTLGRLLSKTADVPKPTARAVSGPTPVSA